MNNPLNHNQSESSVRDTYRPLLELSQRYGYAKDYLSILARTGKINAKKSSTGQWFALESSVKEYHSNAQNKKLFLQSEVPVSNAFQQLPILSAPRSQNRGSSISQPNQNLGEIGTVPSIVLFNNESSSNAKRSFSKQLNTVILALIAWGGVFVFINFIPAVNLNFDFNKTPLVQQYQSTQASLSSIFSTFLDWLFPETSSPTYVTIEEFNQLQKKINLISNYSNLPNQLPNPNNQIPKTGPRGPIGPIGPQGQTITQSPFNPASLISDISSLSSRVDTLSSRFNNFSVSSFPLPPTNTGGIGPITMNPQHVVTETLTVSGSSTLANLSVSGSTTLNSLTTSGDFSVDTNVLKVDTTNNRVGINNASPLYALDVTGTANISGALLASSLQTTGNFTGINSEFQGTASASYFLTGNTLQVGGFSSASYSRFGTDTTGYGNFITTTNDLLISGDLEVNASAQFDSFVRISNATNADLALKSTGISGGVNEGLFTLRSGTSERLDILNNTTTLMTIASSGNVGIGTTGPGVKLDVRPGAGVALNLDQNNSANQDYIRFSYNGGGDILGYYGSFRQMSNGINYVIGPAVTNFAITGGNVGIGTTGPVAAVDIVPATSFTGPLFRVASGSNERLRIQSDGNVGIGTTGPTGKLNVVGGSGNPVDDAGYAGFLVSKFQNAGQAYMEVRNTLNADGVGILLKGTGLTGSQHFLLGLNGSSKLRIGYGTDITGSKDGSSGLTVQTDGNVGIGTTNPGAQLDLSTDSARKLTTTTWSTGSDSRIKTQVETIDDALDIISKIRPVKYHYTPEYMATHPSIVDTTYYHFIAQEYMQVFPDSVNEVEGLFYLNSSNMIPYAIAGVKELDGQMASLSMSLEELEARLSDLEGQDSTSGNIGTETLKDQITGILNELGVVIEQGLIKVQTLIASLIKTDKLEVGSQESPIGITVYDTATGEPYCMAVTNGITVSTPGVCITATPTPSATPTPEPEISPTPSSTPDSPASSSAQFSPTPTPDISPSPTPEPTVEATITPESTPEF